MTKYKPCCGLRCLLSGCKTREEGVCYCICRLKDLESSLVSLIEGRSYRQGDGIVYEPGRKLTPMAGEEKEKALDDLKKIREKLKTYEI